MESFKPFYELTFKQKMQLQSLYKKEARKERLSEQEQELADTYRDQWTTESDKSRYLRPLTILLLIGAIFRVLYHQIG